MKIGSVEYDALVQKKLAEHQNMLSPITHPAAQRFDEAYVRRALEIEGRIPKKRGRPVGSKNKPKVKA